MMNARHLILRATEESERPNSYPFLPEIRQALEAMAKVENATKDQREQLARGLERYVLEDFSFSESKFGGELLEFSEKFACGPG